MLTSSNTINTDANFLIKEIAERMLSRLEIVTLRPKQILCSGFESDLLLRRHYPNAEIQQFTETQLHSVKKHTVDLIFANLYLPWITDLEAVFYEWRRVLRPQGLLIFTTFGPDTLREIDQHALNLIDMHDVGDKVLNTGWTDPVLDIEYLTVTYKEISKLQFELAAMQMLLVNASLNLEKNSQCVYPLTFEIIHGQAWGGSQVGFSPDEAGIVKFPVRMLK